MNQYFFFREGPLSGIKITFQNILYIEKQEKGVLLITDDNTYHIFQSFGQIRKLLPMDLFCRVHPRYIVQTNRILSFNIAEGHLLLSHYNTGGLQLPGIMVPVSIRYTRNWPKKISVKGKIVPKKRAVSSRLLELLLNRHKPLIH